LTTPAAFAERFASRAASFASVFVPATPTDAGRPSHFLIFSRIRRAASVSSSSRKHDRLRNHSSIE
jgi:hypothetical protein